ncbi:magnesium and cobalt transport protein CorA [Camelimonas abortus]|uniref:Magnesium and cobalt transport protein CorA n=1 Tax=Camelimonas abortus TaxID=1017184 RepID=A0ABV7LHC8_9HYPH
MTVVAAFLYHNGRTAAPVTLDDPPPDARDRSSFVWIGLREPEAAELERLQRAYGLHPLAVEDALGGAQLPKLEAFDDQLFVIAATARLEGDGLAWGQTAFFLGRNYLISVRHGSARAHTGLRRQLEAAPGLLSQGPDYVLHAILDFIVDGYLPIIESIEEDVLAMEQRMLGARPGRDDVSRLFRQRRTLIRFQRALGPMSELCGRLAHLELPCVDRSARPYFRDVHDHVLRVESRVAGLREIITSVFEASNLLEQQRQGAITRQLAAWAAILAAPTAIAGIYGMNFRNMPELDTKYGYYVVLGLIVGVCVGLYARFRRMGWL